MSRFTKSPPVRHTYKTRGDRPVFALQGPLSYDVGWLGSGETITVPVGFETDFASVPRVIDDLFGWDPRGKYALPAVVHDYLYSGQTEYSRRRADEIFLEAMSVKRVNLAQRYAIFWSVRAFGVKHFVDKVC